MRRYAQLLLASSLPMMLLAAGDPRPAEACGGCFTPPEVITSVNSHRMVVSLSTDRTTLWDQIRYTGAPEDFVWVLPVPSAAADIELASGTFFDELDGYTSPQVAAPPLAPPDCPPSPWDSAGGDNLPPSPEDDDGVTIYDTDVVGPYETVTIGSENATALHTWLTSNGYNVPDATLPTIAYYVERGSIFVVLRLAPSQGVDAMQPIRVRYPGYMATFPLKMVTVGASGVLDLSLWVISEQRYEPANYGSLTIDAADLVWDWDTSTSNYADVFRGTIDGPGAGRAWITEYATPLDYIYFSTPEDAEIARVGLRYPYVTRLRTSMLVDHLDEDLDLRPAMNASDVYTFLQAERYVGTPPVQSCPDWDGDGQPDTWADTTPANGFTNGCASVPSGRGASLAPFALLLGAALLLARRSRRRR